MSKRDIPIGDLHKAEIAKLRAENKDLRAEVYSLNACIDTYRQKDNATELLKRWFASAAVNRQGKDLYNRTEAYLKGKA
jgi:hypothetical protein